MPDNSFEYIMKLDKSGKQLVRTPQFPGIFGFLPEPELARAIKVVREFIKRQKKVRGFKFGVESGPNKFTIELSGVAKIFLGWAILFEEPAGGAAPPPFVSPGVPEQINLEINDEIVIQNIHAQFFGPDLQDDEYYSFPRPLSGTDVINARPIGTENINMYIAAYYI